MTILDNPELAKRARELAAAARPGSMERRAWGCAAVALSTTGSTDAARRVLAGVRLGQVRAASIACIDELAMEPR